VQVLAYTGDHDLCLHPERREVVQSKMGQTTAFGPFTELWEVACWLSLRDLMVLKVEVSREILTQREESSGGKLDICNTGNYNMLDLFSPVH
jgi:hypothetical protein